MEKEIDGLKNFIALINYLDSEIAKTILNNSFLKPEDLCHYLLESQKTITKEVLKPQNFVPFP